MVILPVIETKNPRLCCIIRAVQRGFYALHESERLNHGNTYCDCLQCPHGRGVHCAI